MTVELWSATLNPGGPNYEQLREVFGGSRVPLQSATSFPAQLGEEKDVEVYLLDLAALPLNRRAWLLAMVAQKFGVAVSQVEQVAKDGFPIRAADVIVTFNMRAFA
jgi:hypothetical protein